MYRTDFFYNPHVVFLTSGTN